MTIACPEKKRIIIIIIIIIITRMLQLQATVKRFLFDLQRSSRSTYVDELMVSKIGFLEQIGESNCTKHG